MYRIDNATSSGTPPAIPAAGTEAYFQDTAGSGGTIVPAWFIHMIQEEVRQVVTDAGLTPDKTDNGQLSEAIQALQKSVSNPFINHSAFQNLSVGASITAGVWTKHVFDTTVGVNNLGITNTGGVLQFPAGTYRASYFGSASRNSGVSYLTHEVRLQDTTTATTLGRGTSEVIPESDASSFGQSHSIGFCEFTLAGVTDVELQHLTSENGVLGLNPHLNANIEIWKLD